MLVKHELMLYTTVNSEWSRTIFFRSFVSFFFDSCFSLCSSLLPIKREKKIFCVEFLKNLNLKMRTIAAIIVIILISLSHSDANEKFNPKIDGKEIFN